MNDDEKKPTLGEQLRRLSKEEREQFLTSVDSWYAKCIKGMTDAANGKATLATVEVHSEEASRRDDGFSGFKNATQEAAEELKRRLRDGGRIQANFHSEDRPAETIEVNMPHEAREQPRTFVLVFILRW